MAFTKQNAFTKKTTDLPDIPSTSGFTPTDIKTYIQTPADELKTTVNKLVDDLNADGWVNNGKLAPKSVGIANLSDEILNQPKTTTEVQAKLQQHDVQLRDISINVKSFGAVGDGVTDDTQAFIDAASLGLPLLIPYTDNYFKITSTVEITNSIKFEGKVKVEGATGDRTHVAFIVNNYQEDKPLYIINPLIDGGWDGVSATDEHDHAISVCGSKNIIIQGGYLSNLHGDGIFISCNEGPRVNNYSENILIENVIVDNPYRDFISFVSAYNVTVRNLKGTKYNNFVAGIDFEPNNDGTLIVKDITIENSEIVSDNAPPINFYAVKPINDIKIKNSFIKSQNKIGILTGDSADFVYNVDIIECDFDTPNDDSINLFKVKGTVNINKCRILSPPTGGLSRNPIIVSGADDINLSEFAVKDTALSDTANITLTANNSIKVSKSDIYMYAYGGGFDGSLILNAPIIKVKDCVFKQFKNAISIKSNADIEITNNIFVGEVTFNPTHAITIDANKIITNFNLKGNLYNITGNRVYLESGASVPNDNQEMFIIKTYYGTSIPTSGTYKRGDRLLNSTPTVGQPKSWVCTAGGTPGTWVSEGNL